MVLLIDQTKYNSKISAIIILLIIRLFGIPILPVKSNVCMYSSTTNLKNCVQYEQGRFQKGDKWIYLPRAP